MKRGILFIILSILVLSFFITQINFGHGKDEKTFSKADRGVLEQIEQGQENIRVYVKLKSEIKNGKSIASTNVKKEVSNILGNKIKHEFDDKISVIVSEEELIELQNNSNVESIELIRTRGVSLQDSVPLINATITWSLQLNNSNLTGEGETICIIDTGANYSHSDLGGCFGNNNPSSACKILGGWDYCADNITCTTEDSDPTDVHGHGTHVAGIASANGSAKGVAPDSKLIIIKAANSTGTFWDDDLEKAIDWCVNNASTFNISVISMSLGGGLYDDYCDGSDVLSDEIDNAIANNMSVIVAAGNDGNYTHINGPACVQNATPVGGSDKSDGIYSSGNRNNLTLLLAPGVNINSTYYDGAYNTQSGTSMSTPHVAGAFAIINQYRRLEGSIDMTPAEIEDALNDSGKVIHDSSSGLNFSRINLYDTLLEIDSGGVEVSLNSPAHDALDSTQNQTFNCSATDIQLNNLTFYLWNCSSDLINQTSYNATSNNFEIEVNQTLSNGTYFWNCLAYDNNTNSAWATSNYTLRIGSMGVTLNSPADNSFTTTNSTTFNCSSETTVSNLTNITLQLWNATSDSLVYNATNDVSGISNETTFDYNLTAEDDYDWNCLAYDEANNYVSCTSNRTITFDATGPSISLEDPDPGDTTVEGTIGFDFSVSDANDVDNCSLIIDNVVNDTDTSITKDTTQTINAPLVAGTYDWKIKCYDEAGNLGESSERELTISSSGGGTSGGTSGTTTTTTTTTTLTGETYTATDAEFEQGYTKELEKGDKVIFTKNNESHTMQLEEVTESAVRVKISSYSVILIIYLEQTEKVDLNDDNTYDISVTYNSYSNSTANITLKSIEEPIGTRQITDDNETGDVSGGDLNETTLKNPWEYIKELDKKTQIVIAVIGGMIILAGVGYFLYRKMNHKKLGPIFKKKYQKLLKK